MNKNNSQYPRTQIIRLTADMDEDISTLLYSLDRKEYPNKSVLIRKLLEVGMSNFSK